MENNSLAHVGVKGMRWGHRKTYPDVDTYDGRSQRTTNPYVKAVRRNGVTAVNRLSQMAIVGGLTYGGAKIAQKRGKKVASAALAAIGTMTVSGLGTVMVSDLVRNNASDIDVQHGELSHVGIKGMKWGVRRYQNKDGSLTPAGKKRYDNQHEDYSRAHDKKSVKQMSDRELRERNNRLQMEKQYADLTRKKGTGKKVIQTFISTAGTITAVAGAYATYKGLANKGLDSIGDWVVSSIDLTKPFA